ncbi:Histone deacetylase-like amidohydrolase [bacterium HR21]|nr:Histone deacetylase-like amidohydrolase [bacterium HR21]
MTGFVTDERYLAHDTGSGHPERPERLQAIWQELHQRSLWSQLLHLAPRMATLEELTLVHAESYCEFIRRSLPRQGIVWLDPDTALCPASYEVACLAAGGVLRALEAVIEGRCRNAFCAIRPPGHHAERDHAMGFCLFNNVAIAARAAQVYHGLRRILILDWDVHHGNGTQHIFEEDPTVFYVSLHQFPLYPGTGRADERGRGVGEGFTLNIPLPPGSDESAYRRAFEQLIAPAVAAFHPDLILISAGFDAHRDDPLASQRLTEESFRWMCRQTLQWAATFCNGRLVAVLEGGYALPALARSVAACLEEMLQAAY